MCNVYFALFISMFTIFKRKMAMLEEKWTCLAGNLAHVKKVCYNIFLGLSMVVRSILINIFLVQLTVRFLVYI